MLLLTPFSRSAAIISLPKQQSFLPFVSIADISTVYAQVLDCENRLLENMKVVDQMESSENQIVSLKRM